MLTMFISCHGSRISITALFCSRFACILHMSIMPNFPLRLHLCASACCAAFRAGTKLSVLVLCALNTQHTCPGFCFPPVAFLGFPWMQANEVIEPLFRHHFFLSSDCVSVCVFTELGLQHDFQNHPCRKFKRCREKYISVCVHRASFAHRSLFFLMILHPCSLFPVCCELRFPMVHVCARCPVL